MKEEISIELADNGYIIRGEELVQVVEDGADEKNICQQLGRLFMDDIQSVMNEKLTNRVNIKIEIS